MSRSNLLCIAVPIGRITPYPRNWHFARLGRIVSYTYRGLGAWRARWSAFDEWRAIPIGAAVSITASPQTAAWFQWPLEKGYTSWLLSCACC